MRKKVKERVSGGGSGKHSGTARAGKCEWPGGVRFALRMCKAHRAKFTRQRGPGKPFIPPMRRIIFIMPPPFIFFIMSRICSNWLSRRFTSCT